MVPEVDTVGTLIQVSHNKLNAVQLDFAVCIAVIPDNATTVETRTETSQSYVDGTDDSDTASLLLSNFCLFWLLKTNAWVSVYALTVLAMKILL